MHVLHLRNASGYFGAERCIVTWIRTLAARGHSFDLALFDHPDPSTEEFARAAASAGAGVLRLPRGHGRGPAALASLVGLVRSRRIDLIHAHENRSHLMGLALGALTGRPVVATLHGYVATSPKTMRWNAINERILSSGAFAAVTVPTLALKHRFRSAEHVPNAAPESLAASPTERIVPAEPVFGVIARLSREKGIDVFLDAIGHLPRNVSFEVIGEGPQSDALRAHAEASRVRWLGYRPDAAENMRGWTALVIPSRSEGLPIVLLEAMAQEVPIVATSVGGIPDAITDGEDGLLVRAEDGAALADAMTKILEDPRGAEARARLARARFLRSYTLGRIGDQLEALYGRVAKERS